MKTPKPHDRTRFAELQTRARTASEAARMCAIDLRVRYGDAYYRGTCAEQRKLERLQRAETRASAPNRQLLAEMIAVWQAANMREFSAILPAVPL